MECLKLMVHRGMVKKQQPGINACPFPAFSSFPTAKKAAQIKPRQALDNLVKVTSIPWYDREVMPEILHFCEDLITHVPLFELHFTPGLEAVRFLETRIRGI